MKDFPEVLIGVILFAFQIALLLGWIFGLVRLINCDFASPYKCEVVYSVGTVTGLNSFLGWFNFGK